MTITEAIMEGAIMYSPDKHKKLLFETATHCWEVWTAHERTNKLCATFDLLEEEAAVACLLKKETN